MLTPEDVWQIEKDLSSPPFRGVPIGSALASLWHIEVYGGNADWGFRAGLKNRARYCRHYFRPSQQPCRRRDVLQGARAGHVPAAEFPLLGPGLPGRAGAWATTVAPCCTPIRKRPPCCRRSSAAWRPNK